MAYTHYQLKYETQRLFTHGFPI